MILYQVSDTTGQLIMTCPMLTLQRILGLTAETIEAIEHSTAELDGIHVLEFEGAPHPEWAQISIQRLPLMIPQQAG